MTHAAKYDYLELQAYRARLKNTFNVRGVVYTDADERLNRVRIAILPGVAEAEVVRELGRAGVPREAVVISLPEPLHSGLQALHGAHAERVPRVAAALSSGAQCSCDKCLNWANLAGS